MGVSVRELTNDWRFQIKKDCARDVLPDWALAKKRARVLLLGFGSIASSSGRAAEAVFVEPVFQAVQLPKSVSDLDPDLPTCIEITLRCGKAIPLMIILVSATLQNLVCADDEKMMNSE